MIDTLYTIDVTTKNGFWEVAKNILNILVPLITILGTGVAIYGIKIWKKQIVGKKEFQFSILYYKAFLSVLAEIKSFRNPWRSAEEVFYVANKNKVDINSLNDFSNSKIERLLLSQRWSSLFEKWQKMDELLLESEVIWGEEG